MDEDLFGRSFRFSLSGPTRVTTTSEAETMETGAKLASSLVAGDTVLLVGALGAGKTVFVRGVALALGVDPGEVRSPTFTLVNFYRGRLPVYHVDLYRIEKQEDLSELGLEDLIGRDGVALVEWGDRLGPYHPGTVVRVQVLDLGGDQREITLEDGRARGG